MESLKYIVRQILKDQFMQEWQSSVTEAVIVCVSVYFVRDCIYYSAYSVCLFVFNSVLVWGMLRAQSVCRSERNHSEI